MQHTTTTVELYSWQASRALQLMSDAGIYYGTDKGRSEVTIPNADRPAALDLFAKNGIEYCIPSESGCPCRDTCRGHCPNIGLEPGPGNVTICMDAYKLDRACQILPKEGIPFEKDENGPFLEVAIGNAMPAIHILKAGSIDACLLMADNTESLTLDLRPDQLGRAMAALALNGIPCRPDFASHRLEIPEQYLVPVGCILKEKRIDSCLGAEQKEPAPAPDSGFTEEEKAMLACPLPDDPCQDCRHGICAGCQESRIYEMKIRDYKAKNLYALALKLRRRDAMKKTIGTLETELERLEDTLPGFLRKG